MRSEQDWYEILVQCQVKPIVSANWSIVFADVVDKNTFSSNDLDLQNFLGQILHESNGLTQLEENLNYSAERLTVIWPSRFKTLSTAKPYARNPELLANKVYDNRMGNTDLGDGWRYRGRGPLQLTGKDNYSFVGDLMGQDLVGLPELMGQPRYALEACIAWWEKRIPDSMLGDPEKVTMRVNGGLIGLADRESLTNDAKKALT